MKLTLREAARGRALRFLILRTSDISSGCLGEMRDAYSYIFGLLCALPEDLMQYATEPEYLDIIRFMLYREYVRITGVSPIVGLASSAWIEPDSKECEGHMDFGLEVEDDLALAIGKIINGEATVEDYERQFASTNEPVSLRIAGVTCSS